MLSASTKSGRGRPDPTVMLAASSAPTKPPTTTIGRACARAARSASPTVGWIRSETAKANITFRNTAAIVTPRISTAIGARRASWAPWKDRPWNACCRRSYIASHNQMAGSSSIAISHQSPISLRRPPSSIANAPTV